MLMQLYKKLKHGVASAFCRDNNECYLEASAIVFSNITDPATLEALACHEVLGA
jgi:hypothetical protein